MSMDPNYPSFPDQDNSERTIVDPMLYGQVGGARPAERTELLGAEEQAPISAWLIFTGQGMRYGAMVRLMGKSFLIGRAQDCDLVLEDSAVSRQHTRIRIEGPDDAPRFVIHDLATDNGTFVNGVRQAAVELANGDVVQIGRTELTFKRIS